MSDQTTTIQYSNANIKYLPLPRNQIPPPQITHKVLVMYELSGSLYKSWADTWDGVIKVEHHVRMLDFFLWLLDICIKTSVSCIIETVYDCREGNTNETCTVRAYRLWIPLSEAELSQFTSAISTALPHAGQEETVERQPKRHKPTVVKGPLEPTSEHIKIISDVFPTLRIYNEGQTEFHKDLSVANIHSAVPQNHILYTLTADHWFSRSTLQSKYDRLGVSDVQSTLESYIGINSEEHKVFCIPQDLIAKGFVRLFTPQFLKTGDNLLLFALPRFVPTKKQVANRIASVLNVTGVLDNSGVDTLTYTDPYEMAPITFDPRPTLSSETMKHRDMKDRIMNYIYYIIARVKQVYQERLSRAVGLSEQRRIYQELMEESATLFSEEIPGVPTIYHELFKEMYENLDTLRNSDLPFVQHARVLMCSPHSHKISNIGNTMKHVFIGISKSLRLIPAQKRLLAIFFARVHCVTKHCTGANGLLVSCGPPGTGKSEGAQLFAGMLPYSLVARSDGETAKLYTVNQKDKDLRVVIYDELKLYTNNTNNNDTKAQQTLSADGVVVYYRTVYDEESKTYVAKECVNIRRALEIANTNVLDTIIKPGLSRITVIPLTVTKDDGISFTTSTLASVKHIEPPVTAQAFMYYIGVLVSFQVSYWSLHASGGIPRICTTSLAIAKCIANTMGDAAPQLSPRKIIDIEKTAESLMVLDLVTQWYTQGVGKSKQFDTTEQAIFYATNSVIRMEHVVLAYITTMSVIDITTELNEVMLAIKSLIKVDSVGYPLSDATGNFYVLSTTRRQFMVDVATRTVGLGDGLTNSIVQRLHESTTDGLHNLKYDQIDARGGEAVFVNKAFALKIYNDVETAILTYLSRLNQQASSPCVTWDETYYYYSAAVKEYVLKPWDAPSQVPELASHPQHIYRTALKFMEHRTISGVHAWLTPNEQIICASERDELVPTAVKYITWPDKYKVQLGITNPLLIHCDVLNNTDNINQDDTVNNKRQIRHHRFYEYCMRIAGRKPGDIIVTGFSPEHVGRYESQMVLSDNPVQITVRNPLYVRPEGIENEMHSSQDEVNPIFDWKCEKITFTGNSNTDQTLLEHHKHICLNVNTAGNTSISNNATYKNSFV